jgi:cell division septum initiation protein DivIVA
MTYKELQTALRQFKVEGLTDVKLNSSQETLQSEYDQVIERLEIDKMMIELEGFTTKEVLEMIEDIEDTLETYEDSQEQTKDDLTAVDRFIEIVKKTLAVNFSCDYKINRSMIVENKEKTVKEVTAIIARKTDVNTIDFLLALEQSIENLGFDLTSYRYDSLSYFLENLETEQLLEEKTLETYEDSQQQIKDNLSAVDRYIEIIEKTLLAEFNCNYKIEKSEITKNKHKTVKEVLKTIARKTGINELDFRNILQENVANYFYDLVLTGYEYYRLDYCLELFATHLSEIETTEETGLKTPTVLEIVTPENDPSLDTATQYYVDAVNHVFKEFGSNNFITKGYLRLSVVNNVTVNDFIKFLNLNSGISFREFMDCLGYHLISEYQFTSPYSYSKYSLKLFLQDFATHLDDHKLVA